MKIRKGFEVEIGDKVKYLGGEIYGGEDLTSNEIYKVNKFHVNDYETAFFIIDDVEDELLINREESKYFEVIK